MKFQSVHKLVSYLLAVAAVGALATTDVVGVYTIGLIGLFALLSWTVEPETRAMRFLDRAGPLLNVGVLAFCGSAMWEAVRSFPEFDFTPLGNFVLFLLSYKLFGRRTNRDYLQIYVLSALLVLAGAFLAQTVLFLFAFGIYVLLAIWTLILFHLRREIEDNYLVKHLPEAGSERITATRVLNSRRVVGRPFFLVTGAVAVAVLVGAAVVFAAVPRLGVGFLTGAVRRRTTIAGFSDDVTLGHHGVISTDNQTVILRATIPRISRLASDEARSEAVALLYWRGTVYDRYQIALGEAHWVRSGMPPVGGLSDGTPPPDLNGTLWVVKGPEAPVETVQNSQPVRSLLAMSDEQDITVVGLTHPVAFALDQPVAFKVARGTMDMFAQTIIKARFPGEFALLIRRRDMSSGRMNESMEFSGAHYFAYSRDPVRRASANAGRPVEEIATRLEPYLQVPSNLSPAVLELARSVTRGKDSAEAKIGAITEWLHRTHKYTVDLKRDPSVADPLEDFLFHQKAGHCEYFASAAAMLMRLAGIPSRYVHGFLGGEWNAMSSVVTVRDNRAHAWAEAYLGDKGWVRVDATPPSGALSRMGRLRQLFDSLELFWSRWVIDYDTSRQVDVARRVGQGLGLGTPGRRGARWSWTLPDKKTVLIVIVALGAMSAAVQMVRRRRRKDGQGDRRSAPAPRAPVVRLYEKTLHRLAAQGWPRKADETPREFARRVGEAQLPGADALTLLTEHYGAVRYGDHELPSEVLTSLGRAVANLDARRAPPSAP